MGDCLPWRPCYPSSTHVATSLVARIFVVHQSPKLKQHMLGATHARFDRTSISPFLVIDDNTNPQGIERVVSCRFEEPTCYRGVVTCKLKELTCYQKRKMTEIRMKCRVNLKHAGMNLN